QGDLHNPEQAEGEGVVFHERKALAYREKLNGRKRKTKVYTGEVPNYVDSLKNSFNQLKKEHEARNDAYCNLALEKLEDLEQSFYQKIYDKAGEHYMSVHIEAKKGDIADTILLPGDPLRAKYIAENYLDDVIQYNNVRGMLGYTGTYKGKRVSVQGTGMGVPSIS